MPYSIALPFYEFQKHMCPNYSVKDFYEEFEKFAYFEPRLIDIEYKYSYYLGGKTTLQWRCCYNSIPKTCWSFTLLYNSTVVTEWWNNLTDDYEADVCEHCFEEDCECDGIAGHIECCLCGGDAGEYGHNPHPLTDSKTNKCCDGCYITKVLPASICDKKLCVLKNENSHSLL